MSMEEAQAGGSGSAQQDCLQGLLLQGHGRISAVLQPPLNDCAVLHPLFRPEGQTSPLTRTSFQDHVKRLRTSLRTFQEQSPALLSNLQQGSIDGEATPGPSPAPFEAPHGIKMKRQKAVSLLRENALHNAAIAGATYDLDQIAKAPLRSTGYLDSTLNECALADPPQGLWPSASIQEAEKGVRSLTHACDVLAKSIGLETFAEEHTKDGRRSQTLTLAASILVIDVEIEMDSAKDDRWKAVIRLRLSYATDNGAAQPSQKSSGHLADCLRSDIQAVADELLGWSTTERDTDTASVATLHLARLGSNLRRLKKLDDLCRRQHKTTLPSPNADLFAVLEQVSNKILSGSSNIGTGLGKVYLHAGTPYASIAYHTDGSLPSQVDTPKLEDAITGVQLLADSQVSQPTVHSISVTVDEADISCSESSTDSASLPALEAGLHYVALLQPPLLMPKKMADRLVHIDGAQKLHQPALGSDVQPKEEFTPLAMNTPRHAAALTFEKLLASRRKDSDESNGTGALRFAWTSASTADLSRQGVIVSRFAFASLQQLEDGVKLLRQQARINEMLEHVSQAPNELEVEGQDAIIKSSQEKNTIVSTAFEDGQTSVLISIPLPIDFWLLEAKLSPGEDSLWSLRASTSLLSRPNKIQYSLDSSSKQSRRISSLLSERRGAGLEEAVAELKAWAVEKIRQRSHDSDASDDSHHVGEINSSLQRSSQPSKEHRASTASNDSPLGGPMMTRRRSSNLSMSGDKGDSTRKALTTKRTASQASMEDEDEEGRSASRRKH